MGSHSIINFIFIHLYLQLMLEHGRCRVLPVLRRPPLRQNQEIPAHPLLRMWIPRECLIITLRGGRVILGLLQVDADLVRQVLEGAWVLLGMAVSVYLKALR
jgi:hypothetical protein